MSLLEGRLELDSITTLHWIGIHLALVSAVVHLVYGVGFFPRLGGLLFLVATGGFLAGIILVLVGYRRRLVYLLGIPFTGGQVVAWYAFNQPAGPADISAAVAVDKFSQLALIVVLITLYRWDW